MKKINLETCNRQILSDLGIQFVDREIRRMGCGGVDNWTEHHAEPTKETLPPGSLILEPGAFYGTGCVAVKDGRIVDRAFRGACPWWNDDLSSLLVIPCEGEKLFYFGATMDSQSFCYEEYEGLPREPGDWGWNTLLCFNCRLFTSSWLKEIGATVDAASVESLEKEAEANARRERYERALERCELLYPYKGQTVFKARIRWALEDGVADAAKALAKHANSLAKHLRPCGGWPCHYKRISSAWHAAYGYGRNSEQALDTLLMVCSKISQPRLDAAWKIAKILAS